MRSDRHSPGLHQVTIVRAICAAAILVGASQMVSCSKPLLAPTDVRSPFDRYDAARAQFAGQYVEDKYGRRQPNLRARLAPKD